MVWIAARGLLARRAGTALAALGLLTATLGFFVLASTSQTTAAVLKGDISHAWDAPYDLLVRPPSSETALEKSGGLIRPNFLSAVSGGIIVGQLNAIRQVNGVDVAAPIAMIGEVTWPAPVPVDLSAYLDSNVPMELYRLRVTAKADAGLSTIPFQHTYLEMVAPKGTLKVSADSRTTLTSGATTFTCLSRESPDGLPCWAPKYDCPMCAPSPGTPGSPNGPAGFMPQFALPLMVAAVDPDAEAQLNGLNQCITSGSYLAAGPLVRQSSGPGNSKQASIPVLVSKDMFIDEAFTIQVDRARDSSQVVAGATPDSISQWLPVVTKHVTARAAYQTVPSTAMLSALGSASLFLRPGDVTYEGVSTDHIRAVPVRQDFSAYADRTNFALPADLQIPDEARDVWFRPLTQAGWVNNSRENPHIEQAIWHPVGSYDPACIPGFNSLAGGRLETYAAPTVRLPNGDLLSPTRSAAGYVSTPPLLITTLEAAQFFADPIQYSGGLGNKFISAIRVKVHAVQSPGEVSQSRLSRVAADIRDATGLQIDIIRGSSPRAIKVDLPPGQFGRPALILDEPWSVKGVAFRFLRAVTAQNLLMLGLVLVSATILVGETAYSAVRRRRREFGVLRALGWPAARIAWLVELEMLLLGLGAGVLALLIGAPIALALGLGTGPWQLAGVIPLALLVSGAAALLPAVSASRGTAISVIAGRGVVRRSRPPASAVELGIRELMIQWRGEALMGIGAVALGAALLGCVVLITAAFRGQLDTSVLGTYLSGRVRPFHLVIAGLTLAVGAVAAGEIVTLGYIERRSQLGALRALGWPRSHVAMIIAAQGVGLGIAGGAVAAALVAVAGFVLQTGWTPIEWGAMAALVMSVAASSLATVGPLIYAYRANVAEALRGE